MTTDTVGVGVLIALPECGSGTGARPRSKGILRKPLLSRASYECAKRSVSLALKAGGKLGDMGCLTVYPPNISVVTASLRPRLGIRRRLRQLRYSLGFEPEHVVEYLGHPFWYPDGSLIGNYIAHAHQWDSILRIIADTMLPEEPTVCEVGSNIGASLLQIMASRPRAYVVAIEPSDRFRNFLMRNLEASGQRGTEVLSVALGEAADMRILYNNASTASIMSGDYDGHESRGRQLVEVRTLDGVWADRTSLDLLKIDTDGHELSILKGASATLRRYRPLIFIELSPHLVGDSTAVVGLMQEAGYDRFACLSPFPDVRLIGVSNTADEIVGWAEAETHRYCDVVAWSPTSTYAEQVEPLLRLELG